MNNIKHYIFATALVAAVTTLPTEAQTVLPTDAQPMIVTPHQQNISYKERTLCFDITTNIDYEVASDADWATPRKGTDGTLYIHVACNYDPEARTANITFTNTEKGITQTFAVTQAADGSAEDIPTDTRIYPSSATANIAQSSYGIENTYDGDYSSIYHSSYSTTISESNPAILTYNFATSVTCINYVTYVPRQDSSTDGGTNGNFDKVEVYVKTRDGVETLYGTYEWDGSSASHTIDFGDGGLTNPEYVKFKVLSGVNDYASCAEMEFYLTNNESGTNEYAIFGDDVYSTLREGVTEDDIERLSNPFIKSLATKIFNGTYDTAYRVAEYPCLLSVESLSDLWNCPGKYYDQTQGVTGISVGSGTHAVVVSGLPDGATATLKLVAWYNGIYGTNFDGGNPQETDYTLTNGVNVIKYTPESSITFQAPYSTDYDALAYIDYHVDANPEQMPAIKVHFVNGTVNGYLSPDKTNDEMHELTANAKNWCMDVVGNKAHCVWTSAGLHNYCKDIDGNAKGYRQYINVIDSLVQWEHDLLGFTKYDRLPTNKTFAYVNYTYYMFQGSRGVSFIHSQEYRVLSCKQICTNDDDAIWGLSHEWGHQHQIHPYFCWAGMSEVTNNMNSYYNIMKMGYRTSDKINNFVGAYKHFITQDYTDVDKVSSVRRQAYENRNLTSYSSSLKSFVETMQDSTITDPSTDATKALSINEVSVGETLAPFIRLYTYFAKRGYTDFAPDWYEAIRQNDNDEGSTIEKQDGVDKYELLASAQNGNKNGKYEVLKEKYPESVWIKNNYVTASSTQWGNSVPYVLNYIRKVSRLTGYNLTPFFERWGFLRQIAMYIGDYGSKWMIMTKDMYDEFVADMDALGLKTVDDAMVEEMSKNGDDAEYFMTRPTFPN